MRPSSLLRHAALIFFLIIGGYPLLWMGLSSLRTESELRAAPFALPQQPIAENYRTVLKTGGLGRAYLNSFIVASGAVVLAAGFSAAAAYAFARLRFRGKEALYFLFLAGMMIPPHVTLVPLNRLLGPEVMGIKNTYLALIGPYAGFALPISILILRAAFEEVPVELEEAARMDGCSTWSVFWHVALPLVRPAMATVVIFNVLTMWNEFAFALTFVSDRAMRTLPLALWEYNGEHGIYLGQTCAALCLAVLPILFVYVFAQRHIIKGLTAGAVKQ